MTADAVDLAPVNPPPSRREEAVAERARTLSKAQWQRLLLPMMIGTVIVAAAAFLTFSLIDAWSVRSSIQSVRELDLRRDLGAVNCSAATSTPAERGLCLEWKTAVLLEVYTINRRYHQANVALLVRASVKYLGFLTGMLMSLVGAVFVLGRLTEASSQLAAEGVFGKLTIATVSPGLILAVLGTILMLTTVLVNPPTDVTDGNVYLQVPVPQTNSTPGR